MSLFGSRSKDICGESYEQGVVGSESSQFNVSYFLPEANSDTDTRQNPSN